jgi:hypothetical protein
MFLVPVVSNNVSVHGGTVSPMGLDIPAVTG